MIEGRTSRREFLLKSGAVAGAAGLAGFLPGTLVNNARSSLLPGSLPSPQDLQGKLDTIVVLMMENRSFDHYFGWFPGADGKNAGLTYPDALGFPHPTHHLAPDFQGCGFKDPNHDWGSEKPTKTGARLEYNDGALDGFFQASDAYALGYYLEADLPFIPAAARAFTLYDRYFASILGPTYINRHYMWSAQCGGTTTNLLPPQSGSSSSMLGWEWETIFDRAQSQGVSVRYYAANVPFALLYGSRALPWIRPVAEFYADAAAGQLPSICFVDPDFGGEMVDGISGDEHPHGDIRIGQAFMSDIVHAFMSSTHYATGALFINYDEWGGFFDHVSPMYVPDDRSPRYLGHPDDLDNEFGITGFRVPSVAVSPYAKGGGVNHMPFTHESILSLISYRFGLGFLNTRHRFATNIGASLDFTKTDKAPPTTLPSPSAPIPFGTGPGTTAPCAVPATPPLPAPLSRGASRSEGVELNSPAMIEYVERLGYKYKPAKPSDIFSKPDSTVKSLRGRR